MTRTPVGAGKYGLVRPAAIPALIPSHRHTHARTTPSFPLPPPPRGDAELALLHGNMPGICGVSLQPAPPLPLLSAMAGRETQRAAWATGKLLSKCGSAFAGLAEAEVVGKASDMRGREAHASDYA